MLLFPKSFLNIPQPIRLSLLLSTVCTAVVDSVSNMSRGMWWDLLLTKIKDGSY